MKRSVGAALAAGLLAAAWSGQAMAGVTVLGNGFAADCSRSAKAVSMRQPPGYEAVKTCTRAIEEELLDSHDLAGTYVNRGILYLAGRQFDGAIKDFDAAAGVEPSLGEVYVNRGAALVGQGREADGIADIDKGLALGASEPEKAYYNRAIAKEQTGDLKGAYYDYLKASELKPDWDAPKAELARFTVVAK